MHVDIRKPFTHISHQRDKARGKKRDASQGYRDHKACSVPRAKLVTDWICKALQGVDKSLNGVFEELDCQIHTSGALWNEEECSTDQVGRWWWRLLVMMMYVWWWWWW